jgi:hypothetical protein
VERRETERNNPAGKKQRDDDGAGPQPPIAPFNESQAIAQAGSSIDH